MYVGVLHGLTYYWGSSYFVFFFFLSHCIINLYQSVYQLINSFFYHLVSALESLSGSIQFGSYFFQLQFFSLFLWEVICLFTDTTNLVRVSLHLHLFCEQVTPETLKQLLWDFCLLSATSRPSPSMFLGGCFPLFFVCVGHISLLLWIPQSHFMENGQIQSPTVAALSLGLPGMVVYWST